MDNNLTDQINDKTLTPPFVEVKQPRLSAETPPTPRFFITVNELANAFGITSQAAQMWMRHNKIETFKVGNRSALTPENARKFLEKRGAQFKSEDDAFMALKGGSGKTANAYNLAIRLNQYGARVLAVDLDMQGNLTDAFGLDLGENEPVFIDVLQGDVSIQSLIRNINPGLDLIGSSFDNSPLDYFMVSNPSDLKTMLRKILAPIRKNYDYVIYDCSPSLNTLNSCVALTADRVIIPVFPDRFSYKGLVRTIKEFERLENSWNTKINYQLVYTFYVGNEGASQKYLIEYGMKHRERMFSTLIRRAADVKNTIDRKQCIFDIRKSPVRDDFDQLARELIGIKDVAQSNAN